MKTIETWCPIFSGFYSTIWEPNEDFEIEHVNEQREKKGFELAKFDDFEFNYSDYHNEVSKAVVSYISSELQQAGIVKSIEFQRFRSPREYNFANDAIDIAVILTKNNEKVILKMLADNKELFATYLKERYTSCSGFISGYPNNIDSFMLDSPLEHKHKLGSILEFLCHVLEIDEDSIYDRVTGNVSLECSNYSELVEVADLHLKKSES